MSTLQLHPEAGTSCHRALQRPLPNIQSPTPTSFFPVHRCVSLPALDVPGPLPHHQPPNNPHPALHLSITPSIHPSITPSALPPRCVSLPALDVQMSRWFFWWSLFNLFLGAVVGGGLFGQLGAYLHDPGRLLLRIGTGAGAGAGGGTGAEGREGVDDAFQAGGFRGMGVEGLVLILATWCCGWGQVAIAAGCEALGKGLWWGAYLHD